MSFAKAPLHCGVHGSTLPRTTLYFVVMLVVLLVLILIACSTARGFPCHPPPHVRLSVECPTSTHAPSLPVSSCLPFPNSRLASAETSRPPRHLRTLAPLATSWLRLPIPIVFAAAGTIELLVNGDASRGLFAWSSDRVIANFRTIAGQIGPKCFEGVGSSGTAWMEQTATSHDFTIALLRRRVVGVKLSALFAIRSGTASVPYISLLIDGVQVQRRTIAGTQTSFARSPVMATCGASSADIRAYVYLGVPNSEVYVDGVSLTAYVRPAVVFGANVADRQSTEFPTCTWGTFDVSLSGSGDAFVITPSGGATAKQLFSIEELRKSNSTADGAKQKDRVVVTVSFTAVVGLGAAPQLSVRQFSDAAVSVEVGSAIFTDDGTHSVRVLAEALWVEVGFIFSSSTRPITGIAVVFTKNGTRTETASALPSMSHSTIHSASASATGPQRSATATVMQTQTTHPTMTNTSTLALISTTSVTVSASVSVPHWTGTVSPTSTTPSSITTSSTVASSGSVSQSLETPSSTSAPSRTTSNQKGSVSLSLAASITRSSSRRTVTPSWSVFARRSATTTVGLDSATAAPRAVPAVAQATKDTAVSGAVAVSVVSSAVGSVGGGAFALQRVAALASFCQPFDPDERPGVLEHPLRFVIGSGRARHSVGSAVGALILFGAVMSAVVALAVGRGRLKTKRWMWRFRDLAPHAAAVRGTALLAAGYAITGPMVVGAAVEAAVQGGPAEAVFGCTAVLLVLLVPAVTMILLWHPVQAHASFAKSVGARSMLEAGQEPRDPDQASEVAEVAPGERQQAGGQNSELPRPAPFTADDDDPLAFLGELGNDLDRPLWTDAHARPRHPDTATLAARASTARTAVVAAWRWLWAPSGQWSSVGEANPDPLRGLRRALSGPDVALPVFGPLFTAYRAPWHWFLAAEAYAALAVAAVSAASAADVGWACVAAEAAAVALSVLLLVAVVVLRPYLAPGDALMAVAGSVLEALAAVLRVAGVEDTVVAAVLLALAAVAVLQLLGRTVRRIRVVIRRRLRPRPALRAEGADRPEVEGGTAAVADTLDAQRHCEEEMVAVFLFDSSIQVLPRAGDDPDADVATVVATAVPSSASSASEIALGVGTDEGMIHDEQLLFDLELAMVGDVEAPTDVVPSKPPSEHDLLDTTHLSAGEEKAPPTPLADNPVALPVEELPLQDDEVIHRDQSGMVPSHVGQGHVVKDHAARAEELRRLLRDEFGAL